MDSRSLLSIVVLSVGLAASPARAELEPFGANVRVDDSPVDTNQTWPQLAIDGLGSIHVIWADERPEGREIRHSRSDDEGATWTTSQRVDYVEVPGWFPSIAVDAVGRAYAVWRDTGYNIYFSRAVDGENWSLPKRINHGSTGSNDYWGQSIDVDENGWVYVAWTDDRSGNSDIYTNRSTDGGETWMSFDIRANDDLGSSPSARRPTIRMGSDGVLYVCHNRWEGSDGYPDVAVVRSTDKGLTWISPGTIANDVTLFYQQVGDRSLDIDAAGNVYVSWYHLAGGTPSVRIAVSTNSGVSFQPSVDVPHDLGSSSDVAPAICAGDDGRAYVAWRYDVNGSFDIFASSTQDGGATWSDPSVRVYDGDPGNPWQYNPVAEVAADGTVYVVWMDNRLDWTSYDIWIAKSGAVTSVPGLSDVAMDSPSVKIQPHPVRDVLNMELELEEAGWVTLDLFDTSGRRVAGVGRHLRQGEAEIRWRLGEDGLPAPARGNYYYRLQLPTREVTGRVVLR